ncbi:hypothetical protein Taro_044054, partial [Colocasia esculenta]|nr:hypothetical protein [Colocasia esculenta]
MSCGCCRLDCLCYSLLGRCRSSGCALGRASGCRIGQLVLLVISKFSRPCWWSLCVPVALVVYFVLAPSVLLQMVVW